MPRLFDRYEFTDGYNRIINERQFGQFRRLGYGLTVMGQPFLPPASPRPDTTYAHTLALEICAGDFFIWNFPNAGNLQKAQRYPLEWAAAMRAMADQGAELFLPAHGLPIAGAARIRSVLIDAAEALEGLVSQTLAARQCGGPRSPRGGVPEAS